MPKELYADFDMPPKASQREVIDIPCEVASPLKAPAEPSRLTRGMTSGPIPSPHARASTIVIHLFWLPLT